MLLTGRRSESSAVKQKLLGNHFHGEINVCLSDTYPLLLSLTRFSCKMGCDEESLSEVVVFLVCVCVCVKI